MKMNKPIRIGLIFLILASAARWFLRPSAALSEDLVDGLTGFLYGVCIATLLLGIWRASRRSQRQ